MSEDVSKTLVERGAAYGDAWWLTGFVVAELQTHTKPIMLSCYMLNWITILCKLMRLLKTPNHLDSWVDIAGYAQLVVTHLSSASQPKEVQ